MLMVRSDALMQLQESENRKEDRRMRRASLQGLTWDVGLEDMRDAVTGILGDLHGTSPRKSVTDILMHGNRLRGLGIAMVVAALVGCLIHGLAGSE